jgi:sec-independent protein translocase protein TatB
MQMFGIGVLELLVIMLLTVLVVGPDRMPQVAADIARWIRHTRAYARHLMGDFNSVVGELQKEANVSQEDWKEITNQISRNTGELGKELERAARDVEEAGDIALAKAEEELEATHGKGASAAEDETEEEAPAGAANGNGADDKPWYEPEKTARSSRRRRSDD